MRPEDARIHDLDIFERVASATGIHEGVLRGVAAVGLIATFMIAPGLPAVFAERIPKSRKTLYIRRSLSSLSKKGLVRFVTAGGVEYAELTAKGREYMEYAAEKERMRAFSGKKWDGKYRLVIFDIPEKKRGIRDQFRTLVKNAGFYHLQDSVWAFPYDCRAFITFLKSELRDSGNILYIVASEMEGAEQMLKYYKLRKSE